MSPTKGAWLWSHVCFKILPFAMMQRVTHLSAIAELLVLLGKVGMSYFFCFLPYYNTVGWVTGRAFSL